MATTRDQLEAVRAVAAPLAEGLGLAVYDVELTGAGRARTLRITVERDGGVDLEAVAAFTQAVSPALDGVALGEGPYLLEVSSPGVERVLRRPDHYRGAVGATVALRVRDGGSVSRLQGVLTGADDDGCTVEVDGTARRVAYTDVTQARTVFEWGPAPRPDHARAARRRPKEKSPS